MAKQKTSIKQKVRNVLYSTVAGAVALSSIGCGSMNYNIRPSMSASTDEAGNLEAKAGVTFTGEASENPEYHGGFWTEAAQTVFGPFHVYRAKDGKWFPEFQEHPYRTTGMTVLYIGAAAAAMGGHGGGGSGSGSSGATGAGSSGSGGHSGSGSSGAGSSGAGSTGAGSAGSSPGAGAI